MKLRNEGSRSKGLQAKEVLRSEEVKQKGFNPDLDISPEDRAEYFAELDAFAEQKKWFEYVVLFNRLHLLFPDLEGRQPQQIPLSEIIALWTAPRSENQKREIWLQSNSSGGAARIDEGTLAAELKAYGLPIDSLFGQTESTALLNEIKFAFNRGTAEFHKLVLAAVRLGLRRPEEIFSDREGGWNRLVEYSKNSDGTFKLETLAIMKVLFPEKSTPDVTETISKTKAAAHKEMNRFGPSTSAHILNDLQMALADSVHLGNHGEFLIQKGGSPQGFGQT